MPLLRSKAIASADWQPVPTDETLGTLTVEFTNGREYTHEWVPKDVYEGLLAAPSAGAFYNAAIKGQY
jgi:KTSC domain